MISLLAPTYRNGRGMKGLAWSRQLSIGNVVIDAEHRNLIRIVNDAIRAITGFPTPPISQPGRGELIAAQISRWPAANVAYKRPPCEMLPRIHISVTNYPYISHSVISD